MQFGGITSGDNRQDPRTDRLRIAVEHHREPLRRVFLRGAIRFGLCAFILLGTPDPASPQSGSSAARELRIGTSGDYVPFSDDRGELNGFDITVARAWAGSLSRPVQFVRFRWPELLRELAANRFDVAMSGITVRPERSVAGRFSVPVAETGAILLVHENDAWREATSANRPGVRIAVNAGGHLERVARKHFPGATLVAIPDNRAVLAALVDGEVDAAVTDTLEAPGWIAESKDLRAIGPFTLDRKAALLPSGQGELNRELDRWLLAREADGSLARWRLDAFGEGAASMPRTATPLRALLAAVDERLALMPEVAIAKHRAGLPTEVRARERVVLEAAALGVERAIEAHGGRRPSPGALREFFRVQIEAAKQVQRTTLRDAPDPSVQPLADLETGLRPALLRIGDRVAALIPTLPANLSSDEISAAAGRELRVRQLSPESRNAIARAIAELSASSAPTERPRPTGSAR